MRIGLSTAAFFGRYETEEAAARISGLSVDCAEVFLQTASEYSTDFARLVRKNLGGVPCGSVHPLGTQFENALPSRSQRQRQDAFDVFRRVLDAGQALGAGCYVYHGRFSPQRRILPWNLDMNMEALAPMCEEAGQRGMVIAWENVFWCQLTGPERVLEARKALPQVRFTLDIKQARLAGSDPIEMARAMGDALFNVHVVDHSPDGRLCLPGEGCFDFAALGKTLREIGYGGAVVLEPYLDLVKNDEALARAIAFLREAMGNDKELRPLTS